MLLLLCILLKMPTFLLHTCDYQSSIKMTKNDNKKVLLAYSGGLDTTCILAWLIEKKYQVLVYMVDCFSVHD